MHHVRKQSTDYSMGDFGQYVVKDFIEQYKVEGDREYETTKLLSLKDMSDHGTQKFVVAIARTVPLDMSGSAFATQRALCTLADFFKNPKVAPGLTRGVALNGVMEALTWLHTKGAAHGDIKPDNVFVPPSGDRVFLADFGLSCIMRNSTRKLAPASGTVSHRFLWLSRVTKQYNDAHSFGLMFANTLVPAEHGGRLFTGDVVITLGQEATTQEVFEQFLEYKLRGPGSMYLPYLYKALRRDPNSQSNPMDAKCALLSLRAATEAMMAKEKAEFKRPSENRGQAPPSKRVKIQAVIVPAAPAKPIPLTKCQKRARQRRRSKAKRKKNV